jgi:flagellar biosynthesis/type III secretory pathway M-ring protein FliF/YscJ
MNNLSKQQKAYAIVSLAVVAVLVVITVWKKPDYHYKDTTDYAKLHAQSAAQQVAYADYLASIKTRSGGQRKII